ncbi:MAG: hypothetical protein LBN38_02495, partial [Verrucomicrobiota bacterium]|nr:hypothetical protein [Verrucomicrobiota bacterium]
MSGKKRNKFSNVWKNRARRAALWGAVLIGPLAAAVSASPIEVTAARQDEEGPPSLRISFDFPARHFVYAGFSVADGKERPLTPLHVPEPDRHAPMDLAASYTTPFCAWYTLPEDGIAVVSFQGCSDSMCFLPESKRFRVEGPTATQTAQEEQPERTAAADSWQDRLARRGAQRLLSGYADADDFLRFLHDAPEPLRTPSAWRQFLDDPTAFQRQHGLGLSLLLTFLGGFLLNLTPCVLPMIPVNLLLIGAGASSQRSRASRVAAGSVYGLGMALAYGALGLVVVLSGTVFGALNASPWFNAAIALLFAGLALAMFDVWQLD